MVDFANDPFEEEAPEANVVEQGKDPSSVNAQVASILEDAYSSDVPIPTLPNDCYVTLPGGLDIGGVVVKEAEVRELDGDDEEALAKATMSSDPFKYLKVLLDRGVVKIGDNVASPHLLRELLIGDREALILGIRRATFGNKVEIEDFYCPFCDEKFDVTVELDGIPVRSIDLAESTFEVPLRKGGKAEVRLPNGHDQEAVFSHANLNGAEQNTVLLSRCVLRITDANGKTRDINGSTTAANKIGVSDRRKILEEFEERQPGPRYDEVKMLHENCGKELSVPLTVVELFRGF